MEQKIREFLGALTKDAPGLQAALRESIEDCGGDDLPIILLGNLGTEIAREFEQAGKERNERIFALIEEGVGDDGKLGTAVTTGLIEALVGEAEQMNLWQPISESFGKLSRAYIDAWFAQQERIAHTIANG